MSDRGAVQKECNDLFIEFLKNIWKNATKKFGLYSLEHGGYSNSESGATIPVQTVWKSDQERGW